MISKGSVNIKNRNPIVIYIAIVEGTTFLLVFIQHVYKLFFESWSTVLESFMGALFKNQILSQVEFLKLSGLWMSSIITKKYPVNETLNYIWVYKITLVGVVVFIGMMIYGYIKSKEVY